MDALRGYGGDVSLATVIVLRNRRHVREQLGRVPDLLDELVPERRPGPAPATPGQGRMLVFQRDQRGPARQRWPGTDVEPDDDCYRARERAWRTGRDRGASSLVVVPAQVAALTAFADQAGGSPADTEVRRRYCESVPERDTIDWPPERNAACWCGSGHKYKKCCGRPG